MRRTLRFVAPAGLYYGAIFVLSAQSRLRIDIGLDFFDKILHVVLYAGLGVCLAYAVDNLSRSSAGGNAALAAGIGLALGVLDEIHQVFVPGRHPDVLDVVMDVVGTGIGIAMFRGAASLPALARRLRPSRPSADD